MGRYKGESEKVRKERRGGMWWNGVRERERVTHRWGRSSVCDGERRKKKERKRKGKGKKKGKRGAGAEHHRQAMLADRQTVTRSGSGRG